MARKIPNWIGKINVPETRATTVQLLTSLAKLINEYETIQSMFKELGKSLPTHVFLAQSKDIAHHLALVMDEKKLQKQRTDYVWVGKPRSDLGSLNVKLVSLLHQYFDEPDYVIRSKHPPKTQEEIDEA